MDSYCRHEDHPEQIEDYAEH